MERSHPVVLGKGLPKDLPSTLPWVSWGTPEPLQRAKPPQGRTGSRVTMRCRASLPPTHPPDCHERQITLCQAPEMWGLCDSAVSFPSAVHPSSGTLSPRAPGKGAGSGTVSSRGQGPGPALSNAGLAWGSGCRNHTPQPGQHQFPKNFIVSSGKMLLVSVGHLAGRREAWAGAGLRPLQKSKAFIKNAIN